MFHGPLSLPHMKKQAEMALTLFHTVIINVCIFTAMKDFDVQCDILRSTLK